MNWLYLAIAVGLYVLSCVPMFMAGMTDGVKSQNDRMILLVIDALLTLGAYIFFFASFPTTGTAIAATVTAVLVMSFVGTLMKNSGYDPYQVYDKT